MVFLGVRLDSADVILGIAQGLEQILDLLLGEDYVPSVLCDLCIEPAGRLVLSAVVT